MTFLVSTDSSDDTKFTTRQDALDHAQSLSAEGSRAIVRDTKGHLKMIYSRGVLEQFVYETRPKRS